jgi:O-antigen ligase
VLGILLNPVASIDALILGIVLLIVGHFLLREKLLLAFLILRPAVDMWRDTAVVSIRDISFNVNAVLSVGLAIWIVIVLVERRVALRHIPVLPIFAALGVLMAASTLWSVAPADSLIESIKWFNAAGLFAVAFVFIRERAMTMRELAIAIALSAIIPALAGILQMVGGGGISTFDIHGRIFGTLAHPNVFAFLLLSVLVLESDTDALPLGKYRPYVAGLLGILIIFTYTRAAVLGAAIFFAALGAVKYRTIFLRAIAGIALGALILLPLGALISRGFNIQPERIPIISRFATRNEDADSIAWRQAILRESIPLIAARPILGYGYGTFENVWSENRGPEHFWDDSAESHNDYLRIALELGAIGLALYTAFFTRLLAGAWRHSPHLFAWVLRFAAVSVSDNMLPHTPVRWLTFAWWGAMFGSEHPKSE